MIPGSEALVSDVDALDLARRPLLLPDDSESICADTECDAGKWCAGLLCYDFRPLPAAGDKKE